MLLLGVFSIFSGFMYNDIFSKCFAFNKSYFVNGLKAEEMIKSDYITMDPGYSENKEPHLLGLDPIWEVLTSFTIFVLFLVSVGNLPTNVFPTYSKVPQRIFLSEIFNIYIQKYLCCVRLSVSFSNITSARLHT